MRARLFILFPVPCEVAAIMSFHQSRRSLKSCSWITSPSHNEVVVTFPYVAEFWYTH